VCACLRNLWCVYVCAYVFVVFAHGKALERCVCVFVCVCVCVCVCVGVCVFACEFVCDFFSMTILQMGWQDSSAV